MLILTHAGPGYRSRLVAREAASAKAEEVRQSAEYTGVQVLESTRAKHPTDRFFVVCLPADDAIRAQLLAQFQQERRERAEAEGPEYVWAPDPDAPFWHLLSCSGQVYEVDNHGQTCSCRDFGVCRDNGLICKHLVAFEHGWGTFLAPTVWHSLQRLASRKGQPPAERPPVAVPVAA